MRQPFPLYQFQFARFVREWYGHKLWNQGFQFTCSHQMSHLAMTSLKFSFLERDKGNNYSESILVTQFLSHNQYKKQVTINAGYLITFIAEKNLSYNISSFNESTGFGLLKASPVEFVRYPFQLLTHASYKSVILLGKQHFF